MSSYPLLGRILTVVVKAIASIIIAAVIVVFVAGILLLRACQAPLFHHSVEVYLRNKSQAPLQVSFVVPTHEVVLDTIWVRGGQESGNYVIGSCIIQRQRLQAFRLGCAEALHGGYIEVEGAADTVFRSHHGARDIAWFNPNHKLREEGVHPASPRFRALNKKVDALQQPSAPGPPIKLERFVEDSVRLTWQIPPGESLLAGKISEASKGGDPARTYLTDFALASAHVTWQTHDGRVVRLPFPAKAKLDASVKRAPDPETTKYFSYIHYFDFQ